MNQQDPTADNFFDNVGGGGSPSAKLSGVDDFVYGEIVDQRVVDHIPFGKSEPDTNKDGSIRKQLVVTLQTDLTNWAGVSKIPTVDRNDPNSPQKHPSEDDGKRSVYLPQWSNIQYAVAQAVEAGAGKKGPLLNGGTLGVKVFNLKDTGQGNPLKEHQAKYVPPVAKPASDGFFGGDQAQPAAAAPPVQQAPPTLAPEPTAPVTPPAGQDPWASPAPTTTGAPSGQASTPPF